MSVKLTHFPKAAELLSEGDFQVSMDLKSFYYHLMIFPPHQTFLGIAADLPDGTRRFLSIYSAPLWFGLRSGDHDPPRQAHPRLPCLSRHPYIWTIS